MAAVTTIKMTGTQTIVINPSDGILSLSVQAAPTGGSFSFLGNYSFQNVASETLTLGDGQGVNLTANTAASPLSDITIIWLSGVVNVVLSS